ncbi:MAG: hypothetical protein LBJ13_03130, partial [Puniceicoccales bacterium]|nr:hypothetical protein [Puniceicoccales bacterium]
IIVNIYRSTGKLYCQYFIDQPINRRALSFTKTLFYRSVGKLWASRKILNRRALSFTKTLDACPNASNAEE